MRTVSRCVGFVAVLEERRWGAAGEAQEEPTRKAPRIATTDDVPWECYERSREQIEVCGDSVTVLRWMQGQWRCQQAELRGLQE